MKFIRNLFICMLLAFAFSTQLSAAPGNGQDYDFQQERMLLSHDTIYIISCFDSEDHITAYSYYGTRLWDAPFHAKILSWQLADDYIFVFSKSRQGVKTYLTCINSYNGAMIWQRP